MIQQIAVVLILVAAIGYTLRRITLLVRKRQDPCYGCSGCALKNQALKKKSCEKFGQSK